VTDCISPALQPNVEQRNITDGVASTPPRVARKRLTNRSERRANAKNFRP
jgi:hypothetical protein